MTFCFAFLMVSKILGFQRDNRIAGDGGGRSGWRRSRERAACAARRRRARHCTPLGRTPSCDSSNYHEAPLVKPRREFRSAAVGSPSEPRRRLRARRCGHAGRSRPAHHRGIAIGAFYRTNIYAWYTTTLYELFKTLGGLQVVLLLSSSLCRHLSTFGGFFFRMSIRRNSIEAVIPIFRKMESGLMSAGCDRRGSLPR